MEKNKDGGIVPPDEGAQIPRPGETVIRSRAIETSVYVVEKYDDEEKKWLPWFVRLRRRDAEVDMDNERDKHPNIDLRIREYVRKGASDE